MEIDSDVCVGCGICVPYCPMTAISLNNGLAIIDLEKCVECGTCKRVVDCPTDAITETPLEWPRSIRKFFSDPVSEHKETGIPGRGTEEMKTNDVTERFGYGEAGWYGNQTIYADSFLRLLKGEITPQGKLPVKVSDDFPMGAGITF